MPRLVHLMTVAAALFWFIGQTQADPESSRIEQLVEALDDENFRYGASIALVRLGNKAVPELRKSLSSKTPGRRVWSAYTLGEIGPRAECAVGDLMRSLGNDDSALRAAAAQALGKIGASSAPSVGALAGLLGDRNPEVRRQSVVALGQIGPGAAQATPQLIMAVKDSRLRQVARNSLVQIGRSIRGALQQSLDDDEIRFDVSTILSEIDPDAAKQAGVDKPTCADLTSLRLVLHDQTRLSQERTTAAAALASLGRKGIEVLIAAFEQERLASTAARALAKVGPAGVAPLIEALAHDQPGVRAAAANALGHIGPAANEAVPHLVSLFQDSDHKVRLRAVRALDAFGQKASPAVPDLIEFMLDSSQREPARQWAIMTLGNTLPDTHDEVVQGLIKASLDKGNYGVSSLAKSQVRKIDREAAEAAGLR